MSGQGGQSGGNGPAGSGNFDDLARQYFGAWGDALGQAGAARSSGGHDPSDWRQLLDWWSQLVPERGPGAAEEAVSRFRQQAGGWYGTMQDVAAKFAGRDTSSAEVAQAWREAVQSQQGDGLLQWMLQGARGSVRADENLPDIVAMLEQWQQQLAPFLQGPAFGPGREHQARWQALLRNQSEYQAHSKAYVEQIKQALEAAFKLFEQRLAEHESPGSQLTSARAMFDLWIEVAEEAYAKVALSEAFQQVYADLGNAHMRLRGAVQQEMEQMSERAGLPTRSEMDSAHRRIAELERQLRRLQATVDGLLGPAAASDAGTAKARVATKAKAPPQPKQSAASAAAAPASPSRRAAVPARPAKSAKRPAAQKTATKAAGKARSRKPEERA